MKILVFSDIHGALPVVERMLALVERHAPEAIVILGDVLYHGPRNVQPSGYDPGACALALTPLASRIIAVKGNCDSEVDEMVLPFILSPDFVWILDDGLRICATHGHRFGPHNVPRLMPGDVLLSGHTHVPTAESTPQGIHVCNPGSMAIPKEGSPPCFGLIDDGVFQALREDERPYLQLDLRARN